MLNETVELPPDPWYPSVETTTKGISIRTEASKCIGVAKTAGLARLWAASPRTARRLRAIEEAAREVIALQFGPGPMDVEAHERALFRLRAALNTE